MAGSWFFRFIDWSYRTRWMMTLVVLTCLAVGGWGFYAYYGPQFAWIGLEHWYVFPFVPDCPLFVYLFALVMIGKYLRIEHPAFTAFVALGNIKYGIWTIFVLFYYFDRFFAGEPGEAWFRSLILALHVGMVPLGILLWRTLPGLKPLHIVGAGLGLLLYDYVDYFFTQSYQVYPIGLPNHGVYNPYTWQELGLVPWFTILETLVLTVSMYWLNATTSPRVVGERAAAPEPVTRP